MSTILYDSWLRNLQKWKEEKISSVDAMELEKGGYYLCKFLKLTKELERDLNDKFEDHLNEYMEDYKTVCKLCNRKSSYNCPGQVYNK